MVLVEKMVFPFIEGKTIGVVNPADPSGQVKGGPLRGTCRAGISRNARNSTILHACRAGLCSVSRSSQRPQASCQPPFAGAEAQLPGQPSADGAPSAFADQLAGAEGQDEAPAGTSPTERQASPAPDALPAEEPGQPAERLICRHELDAGAAQASAGGRDGCQDGRA